MSNEFTSLPDFDSEGRLELPHSAKDVYESELLNCVDILKDNYGFHAVADELVNAFKALALHQEQF